MASAISPPMLGAQAVVLGKAQILGTDAEERVAIQHPAGNFSYALNTDDSSLNEFTIGAGGKANTRRSAVHWLGAGHGR